MLDTNVVSESVKTRPDPGVVAWLAGAEEDRVFLSVVTIAEIRHGIARLPDTRRRQRLDAWLRRDLMTRFDGRILAIDVTIADRWGEVVARRDTQGRPIGVMDAFIAATAAVHGHALVTRNAADFERTGIETVNPWTGS